MGKWSFARIGDAFPYIRNGASIQQTKNVSGYPITRIETISDGSINRAKMGYADIRSKEPYVGYVLQDGDILMSHINSVTHLGKSALYSKMGDETVIHGMNLLNLRGDCSIIMSKYANYYFSSYSFKRQLPNITKNSVNQSSFNITALKELKIPLPPLPIQKKIADILDYTSNLIEKRKAQIEKLDLLVKSQFIEIFGDPVTNPMGWEIAPLSEHLQVVGGYAFNSNGFINSGIPVLRIGNINTGLFRSNNLVFWHHDTNLERYLLYPGDIVISLTGTVGKDDYANVCILGYEHERYYLNQRNAKLALRPTLDRYYLANVLRVAEIKKRLTGISRGIRQANISNSDILNLILPVPPIELQNRFADFVCQVDKSKFEMQQGLEELERLYKSLMQKCFNGEIY
jgi:type I restriction enzyme S subunit